MQAAATRRTGAQRLRRADRPNATPHLPAVDDLGLLDALPIAAAIFSLNDGKLWIEATNSRFLDLAGCHGDRQKFAATFRRFAEGDGGAFTLRFLGDPAAAADEFEFADGEGVARRFLKAK